MLSVIAIADINLRFANGGKKCSMETREIRVANLRRIVDQAGGPAAFSRLHPGVDPTYISQILNGHRAFGERAARNMEKKLDLPGNWFDDAVDALSTIGESISPSPRSDVAVFDVLDVKAACGAGASNADYPEIISSISMPPNEARQLIGSTNRSGAIRIIVAAKDSMVPNIQPDDLLFVDTSVHEYSGEAVYILLHGGELVCKRLSLVGRTLIVSSDNKAYPSWEWSERPDATRIVGKVLRILSMSFKKLSAT